MSRPRPWSVFDEALLKDLLGLRQLVFLIVEETKFAISIPPKHPQHNGAGLVCLHYTVCTPVTAMGRPVQRAGRWYAITVPEMDCLTLCQSF